MRLPIAAVFSLASLATALVAAGCSRGAPAEHIDGLVSLDGKPLADIRVTFQPQGSGQEGGIGSSGVTDANGRFTLRRVDDGRDGAVQGMHSVTLSDKLAESAAEDADAGPALKAPKSRIPAQYANARFPFQVKAGEKNEPKFELKSRP